MRKIHFLVLPVATLAIAACGTKSEPTDAATSPEPVAVVSPVSDPSPAGATGAAAPEDDSGHGMPPAAYTAWGDDFRAVLKNGRLSVEGAAIKQSSFEVSSMRTDTGLEYDGGAAGKLTLVEKPCKDGQGGTQQWTATLTVGGKTFTGCAADGATPHADT